MSVPTGHIARRLHPDRLGPSGFAPSVALAILDDLVAAGPTDDAGSAWDAAWIACLTGSRHWAETARREFIRATRDIGPGGD